MSELNLEGLTDAQLRLFAVRCARRVQHLMTDPRSVAVLDVAERYAKGEATDKDLRKAADAARAAAREADAARAAAREADAAWAAARAARAAAWDAAWAAARTAAAAATAAVVVAARAARAAADAAWDAERAEQKKLLGEIREAQS